MRVLIDALGASESSGGMALYAEELLAAWSDEHPDDVLTVLGYPWLRAIAEDRPNLRLIILPDTTWVRTVAQWLLTPIFALIARPDGLLSLSHVVTPLPVAHPRVCTVHDWRHLKNPSEFGRLQRQYRRLWAWSVNRADAAVQISTKTDTETRHFAPRAKRHVIANGQDHARKWVPAPKASGRELVVTFGHHSNKRPELVVLAMQRVIHEHSRSADLIVLGARNDYAEELRELARGAGIEDFIEFPGYVTQTRYREIVQKASVIILASSDEGFGLPVAEAKYFGIPVVAAFDSGLGDIHENLYLAEPEPNAIARQILHALDSGRGATSPELRSWSLAAEEVRDLILGLSAKPNRINKRTETR